MISITVHHNNNDNNSTTTTTTTDSCVVNQQQLQLQKPRLARKPITSIKTTTTSNVEVQYLSSNHFNLLETPPQTPTYDRFFSIQTNELPSLGASKTAIISPAQQQQEIIENSQNYIHNTINKNQVNKLSNNEKENCQLIIEQQQQQEQNKLVNENIKKNKLHSRSISLIINPEFNSNSDDIELSSLRRRKSLPRRTRLRLETDQTIRYNQNYSQFIKEKQMDDDNNDNNSKNDENNNKDNHDHYCSTEGKGIEINVNQNNKILITELSNSSPEILEQFRQTGIILRQISDEFEKSRRRTI